MRCFIFLSQPDLCWEKDKNDLQLAQQIQTAESKDSAGMSAGGYMATCHVAMEYRMRLHRQ